jgi:hypothetical protein
VPRCLGSLNAAIAILDPGYRTDPGRFREGVGWFSYAYAVPGTQCCLRSLGELRGGPREPHASSIPIGHWAYCADMVPALDIAPDTVYAQHARTDVVRAHLAQSHFTSLECLICQRSRRRAAVAHGRHTWRTHDSRKGRWDVRRAMNSGCVARNRDCVVTALRAASCCPVRRWGSAPGCSLGCSWAVHGLFIGREGLLVGGAGVSGGGAAMGSDGAAVERQRSLPV